MAPGEFSGGHFHATGAYGKVHNAGHYEQQKQFPQETLSS
jgi:hypothetical protein